MSAHTVEHLEHTESPSDMKSQIWKTFWILLAFTLVDIALYFIIDPSMLRNWIFIILGVVKAFFIVSIFMHMKFERNFLTWMIVTPMVLVIYLITLMVIEAKFVDNHVNKDSVAKPATEQTEDKHAH
jgi:cytochrome c oxidase subunit IV